MCFHSRRPAPAPPPPPVIQTPKPAPTAVAPEAIKAKAVAKKKVATQQGRKQTIKTSPRGMNPLDNYTDSRGADMAITRKKLNSRRKTVLTGEKGVTSGASIYKKTLLGQECQRLAKVVSSAGGAI